MKIAERERGEGGGGGPERVWGGGMISQWFGLMTVSVGGLVLPKNQKRAPWAVYQYKGWNVAINTGSVS